MFKKVTFVIQKANKTLLKSWRNEEIELIEFLLIQRKLYTHGKIVETLDVYTKTFILKQIQWAIALVRLDRVETVFVVSYFTLDCIAEAVIILDNILFKTIITKSIRSVTADASCILVEYSMFGLTR